MGEILISSWTGNPKYSCVKEDPIAFESSELAIPGRTGRFQWEFGQQRKQNLGVE